MTRTCKTCGCPLTHEFIALEVKAGRAPYWPEAGGHCVTCLVCGDTAIVPNAEVEAAVESYRAAEGRVDGMLLACLPSVAALGGGA